MHMHKTFFFLKGKSLCSESFTCFFSTFTDLLPKLTNCRSSATLKNKSYKSEAISILAKKAGPRECSLADKSSV